MQGSRKPEATTFARKCWKNCAGRASVNEPCFIHYPKLGIQAIDLAVPAVAWRGRWWVVDGKTAQRLSLELRARASHASRRQARSERT